MGSTVTAPAHIPHDRDAERDHSPELAARRRAFAEAFTGASLDHVCGGAIDPAETRGNIENYLGFAQVPLGLAGPVHVNGEHARGDFLIPLATTEGSLVASYSRGMKVVTLAGGVVALPA